jgi:hypothetical protein
MNNKKFTSISMEEKKTRLIRILQIRTNNRLTREQVDIIAEKAAQVQCSIKVMTSQPDFLSETTLINVSVKEGNRAHKTVAMYGTRLLGSFKFGRSSRATENGIISFSECVSGSLERNEPCAALIKKLDNTIRDVRIPANQDILCIYVPQIEGNEPEAS